MFVVVKICLMISVAKICVMCVIIYDSLCDVRCDTNICVMFMV